MVTTCPNCRQQLAVTAADLRVGQGFVRCGRCDRVFNALLSLADDAPTPSEPGSVARGTMSVPALDEQEVLPPLPSREDEIPFGPEDEDVEVVQTHVTGRFHSVVIDDEESRLQQLGVAAGADAAAGADIRTGTDAPLTGGEDAGVDARDEVAREIIRQATRAPIDLLLVEEPADSGPAAPQTLPDPEPPAPYSDADFDAEKMLGNRRRSHAAWYVAATLLVLALAAQYVHYQRHRLVTVPWLEQPIQQVYGLLGERIDPPWELGRYDVSELGGMERSGNATLVLRAAVAVRKDAPRGQPPPLIRAVLSDQWGNVLATNDVVPRDWLLGEAPARIAPGDRLDARLTLPAPPRVAGFALFACLPDAGGTLHCTDGTTR